MSKGSVRVAYLHPDEVSHTWHDAMWRMFAHDAANHGYLHPVPLGVRTHAVMIAENRNIVATAFLAGDQEWLLWVDTDMAWAPDALDRLMEAADPVTHPVVGGLCFGLYPDGYDGLGGLRFQVVPTMFLFAERPAGGFKLVHYPRVYPPDTVTQVNATGSAFLLIHRSVLEKIRANFGGDVWYQQMRDADNDLVGEDFSLCVRAQAVGASIWVHTGVPTNHHKRVWIGEHDYFSQHTNEVVPNPAPDLPIFTHLPATFAGLAQNAHVHDGMLKFESDLARYEQVIFDTQPEVIVETGTHTGASARWFADHGVDVITVDIAPPVVGALVAGAYANRVWQVEGSSVDPAAVERVRELVAGRRCMVVLDSDHSAPHVRREIEAYGPLVSPGCYLVVEDTIFGYGEDAKRQHGMGGLDGSPLDAVLSHLVGHDEWSRDVAIEQTHPVGSNPAGWWVRNG